MVSSTRRTAGCGPACPVVWQGRVGDHSPYADFEFLSQAELLTLGRRARNVAVFQAGRLASFARVDR
jgi:hypothetical protein